MRLVLSGLLLTAVLFSGSVIAWPLECPFGCGTHLEYDEDQRLYCHICQNAVDPEKILRQYNPAPPLANWDSAWIDEGYASHQESIYQTLLAGWQLNFFHPQVIINPQDLHYLMLYMLSYYPQVRDDKGIVFSALMLAQTAIISNQALAQQEPSKQKIMLWFLVGYGLLHLSGANLTMADNFLRNSPASLGLPPLLGNITFMAMYLSVRNFPVFPELLTIFRNDSLCSPSYRLSTGRHLFQILDESCPYLAMVNDNRALLSIFRRGSHYYILTPFNRYFRVASEPAALRLLGYLAETQESSYDTSYWFSQTIVHSAVGLILGSLFALPITLTILHHDRDSKVAVDFYIGCVILWVALINREHYLSSKKKLIKEDI